MHAEFAECVLGIDIMHKGEDSVLHFSLTCLDESKVETCHSKEPVEQLEADLAALRMLIVDQAKHEGMQEGKL